MKHTLFATQIYQAPVLARAKTNKSSPTGGGLRQFNKELLNEVSVLMKEDLPGQKWSKENYRHGYTSYGSVDRLYDISSTFMQLRDLITQQLKRYLKVLEVKATTKDLYMSSMWVNIMPPGSYHTMHIHPFSVISGTYYLQVSPETSPLKLEDPRLYHMMNAPLMRDSARAQQQRFYRVYPKVGEVVFFESWLNHEVPENTAKTPRISISFNYDWLK